WTTLLIAFSTSGYAARLYCSAFSFDSQKLIAYASVPLEAMKATSSWKPGCLRRRGRTSFSSVLVNCVAVLGFRCRCTLRANMARPQIRSDYAFTNRETL